MCFHDSGQRYSPVKCARRRHQWDAPLPDPLIERYKEWCLQLFSLSEIRIERCVKLLSFIVSSVEFHHFADANVSGYGVCSYLRLIDSLGNVSVKLVFSKSRVSITVPRLELTAAVLATRCSVMLER